MSNGNAKWTAGERVARDFVGPHPTLARRIDRAIARAVKARDAEWLASVKAHAPMNWLTVFGAVLDTTTPKAAPGKRGNKGAK